MTTREDGTGSDGRQDEEWTDHDWSGASQEGGGPRPSGRGSRALWYAAVAVVAAAAAALTVLLGGGPRSSPAPAASPPAAAPGSGGGGQAGGGLRVGGGGGSGSGNGGGTMFMGGTVSAVSATSITLGGQSHTITASITSATKFTGVSGASGIKAGDRVTAQITGATSGHPTAAAIQDPAQMP